MNIYSRLPVTPNAGALTPAAMADALHRSALSSAQQRLWQATIGLEPKDQPLPQQQHVSGEHLDLDNLLRLADLSRTSMGSEHGDVMTVAAELHGFHVAEKAPAAPNASIQNALTLDPSRLGKNAAFAPDLEAAAKRTGIPASALAAIVNAEAAKDSGGQWNIYSRNRRSSAAGLGQFLSRTWEGMAETRGTWLNQTARARGWLDGSGQVRTGARAQLLQLRYNPTASIQTTADYARANLMQLERSGIKAGDDPVAVAQTAYLAHHLGAGDAIRYLQTGLSEARASRLLTAQIGGGRAQAAIAATGDASSAHRQWLDNYVGNRIRPDRFA